MQLLSLTTDQSFIQRSVQFVTTLFVNCILLFQLRARVVSRRKSLPILIIVISCGNLAACTDPGTRSGHEAVQLPASPFVGFNESNLPSSVDVVIDATPSMKGFASGARYRSLVAQSLANASIEGAPVRYYQLSTSVSGGMQLIDEKTKAAQAEFYERGNTRLETVIDSLRSSSLTVVITDLFQTNADMNSVGERLREQVLNQGKAIGMFGVRLPFDGRVYDLGFDARNFAYNGERPLYGLVIGNVSDVTRYMKNLRAYIEADDFSFLVLSSTVASTSATIGNPTALENLVEIIDPDVLSISEDRRVSIRIRENNQSASVTVPFKISLEEDIQSLLSNSSFVVRTDSAWARSPKSDQYEYASPRAMQALNAEITSSASVPSELIFQVDPTELKRGTYVFNVVVGVEHWTLPEWVQEWNLPPSAFQDENPDGSKTANLKPFLLNLSRAVTDQYFPHIGTFQVFVRKT